MLSLIGAHFRDTEHSSSKRLVASKLDMSPWCLRFLESFRLEIILIIKSPRRVNYSHFSVLSWKQCTLESAFSTSLFGDQSIDLRLELGPIPLPRHTNCQ